MAIVDLTTKAYPGNFNVGFRPTPGEVGYISRLIDCTAKTLLAASTSYKILNIDVPNGGFLRTTTINHTGEGATATVDIGTSDGGTQISSNANVETTGTVTAGTTIILAAGVTSIYINPDHDLDAAKFGIYFEVFSKGA